MNTPAIDRIKQPLFDGVANLGLSRNRYLLVEAIGAIILVTMLVIALFPGPIAPNDPTEILGRPYQRPDSQFLLGTNDIGQDLLSELIWGTRVSLVIGFTVSIAAVSVGTIVGLYSGYVSNWLSIILLRLIDLTLALPFLPLVIILGAYLGSDQRNVIIILIIVSWAAPARMIRARVLEVKHQSYIEAAHALGSDNYLIVFRHIWPATRTIALVQIILVASTAILAEASLSFLGLGDPSTKSWGTMLYFAQVNGVFLSEAWIWWVLPAGIMITLSVLGLVFIAYGFERRLEPTLR